MTNYQKFSDRPFLIITTIHRPARGAKTSVRGYQQLSGNMESFEQTTIVDRLKPHHLRSATAVVDIMRNELVTHSFRTDDRNEQIDPQAVCDHYLNKYMDVCRKGLDAYLTRKARLLMSEKSLEEAREELAALRLTGETASAEIDETTPPPVGRAAARRLRQLARQEAKRS